MVLLGVVRSNVEDFLIVATLLDKHKSKVDLRIELDLLKDGAESGSESSEITYKKDFTDR